MRVQQLERWLQDYATSRGWTWINYRDIRAKYLSCFANIKTGEVYFVAFGQDKFDAWRNLREYVLRGLE